MNSKSIILLLALSPLAHGSQIPEIVPAELEGPRIEVAGSTIGLTIAQSRMGRRYQLQSSETLEPGSWINVGAEALGHGGSLTLSIPKDPAKPNRFYRLNLDVDLPVEAGQMVFVPSGSFQLGAGLDGGSGPGGEGGSTVSLSPFYFHSTSITGDQWEAVRQWGAAGNGYTDLPEGESKAGNHPVHSMSWHDAVKWCNARSEMENLTPCYTVDGGLVYRNGERSDVVCNWDANGYRLPTQAEWEVSARAGTSGTLYPWGDTISHNQANFVAYSSDGTANYYSEDVTIRPGDAENALYHPAFNDGTEPFTSPVGSFPANGYGFHDLVGNVWQWCWDWEGNDGPPSGINPRGPSTGTYRVLRGGSWKHDAIRSRASSSSSGHPSSHADFIGFRPVRSIVAP